MGNVTRIYNSVAFLCSSIIQSCTEEFFIQYSCLSPSECKRIDQSIQKEIPDFFTPNPDKKEFPIPFQESDLTDSLYHHLDVLSESFKKEQNFFAVMRLIQLLDQKLEFLLLQKIQEFQDDDFSVTLNTNRELTGIGLLPRCSCSWERKHRLSHRYNRMDNFLFHMLLMENSILGELIDKHFFLKNEVLPHFNEKKILKIAATPLRHESFAHIIPYEEKNIQYFGIQYDEARNQEANAQIWAKILQASGQDCDMLLFPEMLGNAETTDYIVKKIQEFPNKQDLPSLIFLPSFWNKKSNVVTVLNRNGDIICKQGKQNPVRFEQKGSALLEGIRTNYVINIFHYNGIGRFAILICKDFLTTKYLEQLMRCFKLTLIIVPSFSTGSYDFRQSFEICASDDCNVIWINTCAALLKGKEENFKNIGYVRKRVSQTSDESQMLSRMPICKTAFDGKCNHDCMFFETIQGV